MFKYTLEKKSQKIKCPSCGEKRFVRYVDSASGELLADNVGRCDREINCAYHYPPKQFFKDTGSNYEALTKNIERKSLVHQKTSFHNLKDVENTLKDYDKNNFILFLQSHFGKMSVENLLIDYRIGTVNNWFNSTIFWQVDQDQKVRGGKIIGYNENGKRTKYINWIHSIQRKSGDIENFNLDQCLFGLHLIGKYDNTIAIVESEKTACIMSLLFDKYLWMATGSLGGLNIKKLKVLKDRKIILYPDLGLNLKSSSPFEQWKAKCEVYQKMGFDIKISNLLEQNSTNFQRAEGLDIADYFLQSLQRAPERILSKQQKSFLNLYQKNNNLKTLVEFFDLTFSNGEEIDCKD
ncbi:DUF6371 domain-containing protein [Flavobacterium ardleyense]|uniref:DUF6371 domain-containing protein n=1 Tax=Flavobacterium ardleyense TaxID=2038737 RepID=UPI00298CB0FB|nr:DUF6371 domain-containing protein [Flavobacterium ardleyense]